jgi:hypothetical protein
MDSKSESTRGCADNMPDTCEVGDIRQIKEIFQTGMLGKDDTKMLTQRIVGKEWLDDVMFAAYAMFDRARG